MARGPRFVSRLAQPIKGLAQRFAFIGLVATAVGLMVLGKVELILADNFRAHVTDAVAPILEAVSRPANSIAKAVDQVRELNALHKENVRLRLNEARLLQWQVGAPRGHSVLLVHGNDP